MLDVMGFDMGMVQMTSNLHVTNGFPILCVSPFLFLGISGVNFHLYFIFYEKHVCKENSPRWDAAFCGVTSGAILFTYVP